MAHITYSAELIPGSNAYVGTVWVNGTIYRCEHKHTGGFSSAKACANLRTLAEKATAPKTEESKPVAEAEVTMPVAENAQPLWLVTKEGVYDHGVYYVGLTEADAQRFTREYAPDDDGYHNWRIDTIALGVPAEGAVPLVTPPGEESS